MRARIADLVAALRSAGLAISVAEAMDAARAAALAGVERPVLCEALAAALVKDEDDRPAFLAEFARVFPPAARAVERTTRGKRGRGARGAAGEGDGAAAGGRGAEGAGSTEARRPADAASGARVTAASEEDQDADRPTAAVHAHGERRVERDATDDRHHPAAASRDATDDRDRHADADGAVSDEGDPDAAGSSVDRARALQARRLAALPFRAMTPHDVDACAALAAAIAARVTARFRRRLAPKKLGRLDFRRTIRVAVPRGGVPFERRFRGHRSDRPDLVALCDVSASAAVATDFFLALLAPATSYFRRVRLFGYVDRLVEIEFVDGQVRPAAPLDLMARSDFGRVLRDLDETTGVLGADTVLLVLGDARNNRRPPRADLLAAARTRVRRLVWLNPEPRERWDTGDSVIGTYARHADVVEACGNLAELERALGAVARL